MYDIMKILYKRDTYEPVKDTAWTLNRGHTTSALPTCMVMRVIAGLAFVLTKQANTASLAKRQSPRPRNQTIQHHLLQEFTLCN